MKMIQTNKKEKTNELTSSMKLEHLVALLSFRNCDDFAPACKEPKEKYASTSYISVSLILFLPAADKDASDISRR